MTGIWLQFCSVVVVLMIPAPDLGYYKIFFISPFLAIRYLAKRWDSWINFIGQRTRWHSSGMIKNNVCLNISVESCCPKLQAVSSKLVTG